MDKKNYKFFANQPIKRKDTIKFVQFTVHANLVTKKLGTKYNSVTQKPLFRYNIIPKDHTNITIKNGSSYAPRRAICDSVSICIKYQF